jgi:hypothetical protein
MTVLTSSRWNIFLDHACSHVLHEYISKYSHIPQYGRSLLSFVFMSPLHYHDFVFAHSLDQHCTSTPLFSSSYNLETNIWLKRCLWISPTWARWWRSWLPQDGTSFLIMLAHTCFIKTSLNTPSYPNMGEPFLATSSWVHCTILTSSLHIHLINIALQLFHFHLTTLKPTYGSSDVYGQVLKI